MKSSFLIQNQFSSHAHSLRKYFDDQFADPRGLQSSRFVWDYWHVPDQYTLMRTPAYHYFPKSLYMKIHKEILFWGRRQLGCWDISPPWLSYYVNGCKQELHSDVPHGPWAFVYSLTPWKQRKFSGGETLLLKPQVLNYWKNFGHSEDRELSSFVDRIPAEFNRLVVFDPRIPHGVTPVHGTQDPREARLVLHGWFTEPKTYIEGPLPAKATEQRLNQAFARLEDFLSDTEPVQGTMSLGLQVSATGRVLSCRFLTNTVLTLQGEPARALNAFILSTYRQLEFPRARGQTRMTIPLIFR